MFNHLSQTETQSPKCELNIVSYASDHRGEPTTNCKHDATHVQALKRCPGCKGFKPYEQFSKDRRSQDGCQAYCKDCQWIHKSMYGYGKHTGTAHISVRQEIGYIRYLLLLIRDNYECQLCGEAVTAVYNPINPPNQSDYYEDTACNLDHIIPRSKGGETIDENLQTTHRKCNAGKGTAILPLSLKASTGPKRADIAILVSDMLILTARLRKEWMVAE